MLLDFWMYLGIVKYWIYDIFFGLFFSYVFGSILGMFSCIMVIYVWLFFVKIWNILKKKVWRDEYMENMLVEI